MNDMKTDLPWEPSMDLADAEKTLAERLEGIAVGDRVVLLQRWTYGNEILQGTRATVTTIDHHDAGRTFEVRDIEGFADQNSPAWFHRVAKVADPPMVADEPQEYEWNAFEMDEDGEEARKSHADRMKWLVVGDRVTVLQSWGDDYEYLKGKTMVVGVIDTSDPRLTFRVDEIDPATGQQNTYWVHRVAKAEAPSLDDVPEPPVEKTPEQARIETLEAKVAEQHDTIRHQNTRFIEFQIQVRDKAIEVAESEGWCNDGLNEALEELGLDPKEPKEWEIEVNVTYTFTARRDGTDDEPSGDFVRDSLNGVDDVTLDDDWKVSDSGYTVDDVTVSEA